MGSNAGTVITSLIFDAVGNGVVIVYLRGRTMPDSWHIMAIGSVHILAWRSSSQCFLRRVVTGCSVGDTGIDGNCSVWKARGAGMGLVGTDTASSFSETLEACVRWWCSTSGAEAFFVTSDTGSLAEVAS